MRNQTPPPFYRPQSLAGPNLRRGCAIAAWLLWGLSAGVHADSSPPARVPAPAALAVALAKQCLAAAAPAESPPSSCLAGPGRDLAQLDLAALVLPSSGGSLPTPANSEQRQPLHLGASPKDQALTGQTQPVLRIPVPLRDLLTTHTTLLARRLLQAGPVRGHAPRSEDRLRTLEFELWPTMNWAGRLTWVFARVRSGPLAPWQWLDHKLLGDSLPDPNRVHTPQPILPQWLRPARRADQQQVFADFLDLPSLYDKPLFSECVFTTPDGARALAAWRPPAELPRERAAMDARSPQERARIACAALPQPARFNGVPITLHVQWQAGRAVLQETVVWQEVPSEQPLPAALQSAVAATSLPAFPASFEADFRRDVWALSGATPLGPLVLSRKSSADPQHQIDALLDALEARYRAQALPTQRQRFSWRGIPQSNLRVVLPGHGTDASRRPIVLADHLDTAFSADHWNRHRQRVSAPGADDNVTAVATLLRAAEVLRRLPHARDIWLLHLTGEEFPADDLGARHHIAALLDRKQDLGVLLLLDMIGHHPPQDRTFQISPGGLFESGTDALRLAQLSAQLAGRVTRLQPIVRGPTDLRSYLYNTDGLIYAEAGYRVVFFNEVMNRYHVDRAGYHDTHDLPQALDIPYAVGIAQVAIATASVLAQLDDATLGL